MGTTYGWHDHVQYNAAKSGVVGLVRGLACDLGSHGIRVNGLAPGFIRTAQALSTVHSLGPEGLEKAAEYIPLGRIGEADEMADVLWVLVCLANQTGVDLEDAIQKNIAKKTNRDKDRHKNNQKLSK